jgi:hypothetical protein
VIDFAFIPMDNFKPESPHYISSHAVLLVEMDASEDTPLPLSTSGKTMVFLVVVYMETKTHANLISYPPVMTICINAMIIKILLNVKALAKKDIQKL